MLPSRQEPRRTDRSARHQAPSVPGRASVPRAEPREFVFPTGVQMAEGENYRQREGYDVTYLKDEETPRYQYAVAVGADRAGELFVRLAGLLPGLACAILEIPAPEGDSEDVCDVWMGEPVERERLLTAFKAHRHLLVNDGMVGFGAVSADGETELFIDEHKLIYLYVKNMEEADAALAEFGLTAQEVLRHYSELAHVHVSLSSGGAGESYWDAAEDLKKALGLQWEESKEYS